MLSQAGDHHDLTGGPFWITREDNDYDSITAVASCQDVPTQPRSPHLRTASALRPPQCLEGGMPVKALCKTCIHEQSSYLFCRQAEAPKPDSASLDIPSCPKPKWGTHQADDSHSARQCLKTVSHHLLHPPTPIKEMEVTHFENRYLNQR